MEDKELTELVIGCALKVHRTLGPGLLESSYLECLVCELIEHGLYVEKQKPLPLVYNEVKLDAGYRIDLLIENRLVVEVKSVEALAPIHLAQILTYLRLSQIRLGLLINFNVVQLKDGLKRVVNGY